MKVVPLLLLMPLLLLASACGGGKAKSPELVQVSLTEWDVSVEPAEVHPGALSFSVKNNGTRTHQLLIIKSDLPVRQLPMLDVSVDESKVNIAGAVQRLQPGESATIEGELFPGKYVLICNLVDRLPSGQADPHYLNGMATPFLVLDR